MKVELIVLLFACFLTHAQITTNPAQTSDVEGAQGPENPQTENEGGSTEGEPNQGLEDPQTRNGGESAEGGPTQGLELPQTENGGVPTKGGHAQGPEDTQVENGLTEGGTTEEPEGSRAGQTAEDDGGGGEETPPKEVEANEARSLRRSQGRGKDDDDDGGSKEKPPNDDVNIEDADYYDEATTAGKPATASRSGSHPLAPGEPDINHNVFMVYKIKNALSSVIFNVQKKIYQGKVRMQELLHHPIDPPEDDSVASTTESSNTTEDYAIAEAFLNGRESVLKPCSLEHMSYIERNQKAGCSGAVQFANDVCEVFFECLRKKEEMFMACEKKVCLQYEKFSSPPECVQHLFECHE